MRKILIWLMVFCIMIPNFIVNATVDMYNFEPFSILGQVTRTGEANGLKRIIVSTANFPFSVTEVNQLAECTLDGTVEYSGSGAYSQLIPFNNVKIETSDVRDGATAIDFYVPQGTLCMDNSEDAYYKWNLTISPKSPPIDDIPQTGSTFFITPDMFTCTGGWSVIEYEGYNVLYSGTTDDKGEAFANVKIPETGTYNIYAMTRDFSGTDSGKRCFRSSVDGIPLSDSGTHGNANFTWQKIGEKEFQKGAVAKYMALSTSDKYSRTVAVMFTTEEYIPSLSVLEQTLQVGKGTLGHPLLDAQHSNIILLADDFSSDMGNWTTTTFGGIKCLYGRTSASTDISEVTANVIIPKDGTYYVWGYAGDWTNNAQGSRAAEIGVNGNYLSGYVGVHGARTDTGSGGALGWDKAGKVNLKSGNVTISAREISGHTRLGAILLTTDEYFNGMEKENVSAEFQLYRGTVNDDIYDIAMLSSCGNKLSYTFKNRTGNKLENAVLVSVIYAENGVMEDVKVDAFTLDANKSLEKIDIIFSPSGEWKTGKVMLWESMASMKPLAYKEFNFTPEDYANPDEGADTDYGTVSSYMLDYTVTGEDYAPEYYTRDGIYNTLKKLEDGEDITIGYLGGSITAQNSWRPYTTKWFEDNYSGNVTEVNIGLAGTNADLAVCRIDQDVLAQNPDLVFVEYAVNGGAKKDMEGMVLKIREHNPTTDIIFVYTTLTSNYPTYKNGNIHSYAQEFETVAEHYNIPSVFFGVQAFDLYDQGRLTLSGTKEDGKVLYTQDGTHLTGDGGYLAAGAIARCVTKMYDSFDKDTYTEVSYQNPASKLVEYPWEDATYSSDWSKMKFEGTWMDCSLDASNNFQNFPYTGAYLNDFKKIFLDMTGTKTAGSSITVKFKGTDIGVFEAGGQFSGQLRVIVDGEEQSKLVLFNNNDSKLRHQYYFIPTLEYGEHTVTFILDETMPDKSYLQDKNPTDTLYEKNEFYLGKILVVGEILDINK